MCCEFKLVAFVRGARRAKLRKLGTSTTILCEEAASLLIALLVQSKLHSETRCIDACLSFFCSDPDGGTRTPPKSPSKRLKGRAADT